VIEADGAVVGEGWSQPAGQAHAELEALLEAGERARGATAYVTLEPCNHTGRTGPCTEALIAAGVSRVVVAVEDSDARARGAGIARLRSAGLAVDVGVEEAAAAADLRAYLHQRSSGRAFCLAKVAVSIDGRTAAADGTSHWITAEEARADAHRLRAESQAVVVGSGTALADQPDLRVRLADPPPSPPLRVLLDARGRVPAEGPLFEVDTAPTLVLTASGAEPASVAAWKESGAEVEEVPGGVAGGLDLEAVLTLLARRDVVQVLVEGGPTLHGALLRTGLADALAVYVGGLMLGGGGRALADGLEIATIGSAPRWNLVGLERLGPDVRLDYLPAAAEAR
jgi:diaminohydroxyphosphoribosylaminopyrimidine deaminase/5-amino-6-(5-phosphoribosylamino)uracil reductase